jgi:hypothetical protein
MTAAWVTAGCATVVAAAGFALFAARALRRMHRRASDFFDDWAGLPPRPGVEGRAGVMARLRHLETVTADIRSETQPNDGTSLRDVVQRTREEVSDVKQEQAAVRRDLATFRRNGNGE